MSVIDETTGEITETEEPITEEQVADAEAEEAEEAEEAQPEPEPEPENAGPSPEELERMSKKLDAEATRHANRLSEIMGDAAQILVPCELCDRQTAGFHLPVEHLHPETDLDSRLLDVLRTPSAPDYQADPFTRACGTCGGLGKTRTGSKVADKSTRVCPTCKGYGFQGEDVPGQVTTNGAPSDIQFNLPDEQPLVTEDADMWGSPRLLPDGSENPNYGRMPQYKIPTLP